MKYLKHIPLEMVEITEYKELEKASSDEFINLNNEFTSIDNNHYLSSLDESGCERMEKIMGITDIEGLSVEERRLKIISKANNALPYTINNLRTKIRTLLENDGFLMTMNYNEYRLIVVLFIINYEKLNYVKENIEGMIPCNIILELIAIVNTYQTFKDKHMTYEDMNNYTHKELRTGYFGG